MQLNSLHVQLPQRFHRAVSRALAPSCLSTVHTHTARRQLHQQQQQLSSSRLLLYRPAADYGEAYDNLFRSKIFRSELVVKEFDSIMTELRQLSMMAARFPDFDLAGKEMFLNKMEEGTERYRIFMKRLELCDDPAAQEYLRYTNAQMLEGGFTLQVMFEGLSQSLGRYRTWLEEEKRVSSDPVKHQAFLAAFREAWSSSAMGAIDMSVLAQVADPITIAKAQKDPEFYKAIKEISDNPTSATMSKWLEHPTIGPLVTAMWKSMQISKSRQQQQ